VQFPNLHRRQYRTNDLLSWNMTLGMFQSTETSILRGAHRNNAVGGRGYSLKIILGRLVRPLDLRHPESISFVYICYSRRAE